VCPTLWLLWRQGAARVHGPADDARRLPNTLSLGIRGLDAAAALAALADSLAASAGAACHSSGAGSGGGGGGDACISGVLRAMAVRAPGPAAARPRRGAYVCQQPALAPDST
jgi:cysteine sulfinate desulfinase/cysteine desulfurase-like protein